MTRGSINTTSRTFHMQKRHLESLSKRAKCGRSESRALKVSLDRYFHLMALGRQMLEHRGITDVVIQSIAEALRWQNMESIDVVQCLPGILCNGGVVDDATFEAVKEASQLELMALADAVEMMFSRYQTEQPKP